MFAYLAVGLLAQSQPPNVVLIFADDLGYREIGVNGQKRVPTPNIDRIAAEGVRMERFYTASPVCAPSRTSLLTGRHSGRSPIRGNKEVGGWELNSGEGQMPLPDREFTIAEGFKSVGYRTAAIGKWGLGGPSTEGHPNRQGFDTFFGYLCQRQAHNLYPAYLWQNEQVYLLPGNPWFRAHQRLAADQVKPGIFDQYRGSQFVERELRAKAVSFLDASKGKPFFLYYASPMPHTALQAPQDAVDKFPRDWDTTPYLGENGYLPNERPRATYAAMIAELDASVGAILKKLDEMGAARNTLILLTSDNGTTFLGQVDRAFFGSLEGLRGTKSTLWDGGIRMPFVARWPDQIPAGSVSAQFAWAPDLLATFAEAAGFRAARQDGASLLKSWTGASPTARNFYFEFPEGEAFQAAILDSRWKVIIPRLARGNQTPEVYDLLNDPAEAKDLASSRADLVQRARAFWKSSRSASKDFPLPGVDVPAARR